MNPEDDSYQALIEALKAIKTEISDQSADPPSQPLINVTGNIFFQVAFYPRKKKPIPRSQK